MEKQKALAQGVSLYPHEWERLEEIGQQNGGRSGAVRHLLNTHDELTQALAYADETLGKINRTLAGHITGTITAQEALDQIHVSALLYDPDVRMYTPC